MKTKDGSLRISIPLVNLQTDQSGKKRERAPVNSVGDERLAVLGAVTADSAAAERAVRGYHKLLVPIHRLNKMDKFLEKHQLPTQ